MLTFMFPNIILGATDQLIGIPVTNTPLNPARGAGWALFVEGRPFQQLWFFWLAPIVGRRLPISCIRP